MSLFGTSPEEQASDRARSSLFDDSTTAPAAGSALFNDDDAGDSSPWGMPTPKKASTGSLISRLLAGANIPDQYIDVFDAVSQGNGVDVGGMSRVMTSAKLGPDEQMTILEIMGKVGRNLGRDEFNVFMALVGLAQEGDDLDLDGVDERRKKLPVPSLPGLIKTPALSTTPPFAPAETPVRQNNVPVTPTKPITTSKRPSSPPARRSSFNDEDPWGSPARNRSHIHNAAKASPAAQPAPAAHQRHDSLQKQPQLNGYNAVERTTSNFTTSSVDSNQPPQIEAPQATRPQMNSLWYSYDGNQGGMSITSSFSGGDLDGGFGNPETDEANRARATSSGRSFGGGNITPGGGPQETIIVTLLPEMEGMFMFQHHNYQVSSPRRGCKVVRRYSDFVWLLDCLHKRYPFRRLPLLPPKRVGVNGSHLAADSSFIEKRRRGLARFANALVGHPVLNQEQLVVMFLTVPTELAVWRKQATISVQDEFTGKVLPPGHEDTLPPSLNDLFETTRSGVRKSAEVYINLCNLMDRLAKRSEGLAADHGRFSASLMSLTDASHATYAIDTNDVPLLNEGLLATAKHCTNSQTLLVDEARAWDTGVLEDLKAQRDALVSMREMFDRRDRLDRDNIPYLEKRIKKNEVRLADLRQKPEGMVKPGEVEKVTESIIKDKESIVAQHTRSVFVKECIHDELRYFQASQYSVSRWNQEWAQEKVKYSELQADNWKQLHDLVESMPTGE